VAATKARDRLDRFTPTCLPAARWALAREAVLAAVQAVPDLPESAVQPTASHLCRFLAWCPDWDKASAPDLSTLLTEANIEASLRSREAGELSPGTRKVARHALRRVARALLGPETDLSIANSAPAEPAGFWSRVAQFGPLVALIAVARARGVRFNAMSLHTSADAIRHGGGLDDLIGGLATAGPDAAPCTVPDVELAARACREARDVEPEVPVMDEPQTTKPRTQRISRKRAIREARERLAEQAADQQARAEGRVTLAEPDWEGIDPAIREAIQNLRPRAKADRAAWAKVGEAGLTAMALYDPPSTRWVQTQAGVLVRYAIWVATRPERSADETVTLLELSDPDLVEAYLTGPGAAMPAASRATVRSVLRRMVRNSRPKDAGQRIGYTPIKAPYAPWECDKFVRLARHQPTLPTRRAMSAMVALGLGAGLDGGDQKRITPAHIHEVDLRAGQRGLVVEVPGDRPRVVVVRAGYEPLLREALALHEREGRGVNQPVYGADAERQQVTSRVTGAARTATSDGVDIDINRLRSTWLLACMCAPIPLSTLLVTAGLRSARSLTDLLPYCPVPDPADVARLTRLVADIELDGFAS
jgi:hypothetical protein